MTTPASPVSVTGPLADHADGFLAELRELGYAPLSAANQLRVMAHLSRWLEGERLEPAELTPGRIEAFLEARRRAGYTCWRTPRALVALLTFLRAVGVVPVPVPVEVSTPLDLLLADYRDHLLNERGLTTGVCAQRESVARQFLASRSGARGEALNLESLTAAEVSDYVTSVCTAGNVGTAKLQVDALRSLLRFLHLAGRLPHPLSSAVPAVAGHRSAGLPKALNPEQTARLLAGCDRTHAVGRRDFAVLVLLTRLGLRAGEVAALALPDIDWRAGEILIRGKGDRVERLPLPSDVGEALVAYLQDGRPSTASPALFQTVRAPQRPLSSQAAIGIVHEACRRAGLPRVGAHRLRHTAATEMLKAGAGLTEVAQALRQRSLATTSIYAKVDRATLRTLAQPWPEVAP